MCVNVSHDVLGVFGDFGCFGVKCSLFVKDDTEFKWILVSKMP